MRITVREYIEHLKTLDQDKGIWVLYDGANRENSGFAAGLFEPTVDAETMKEPLAEYARKWLDETAQVGDYIINAG